MKDKLSSPVLVVPAGRRDTRIRTRRRPHPFTFFWSSTPTRSSSRQQSHSHTTLTFSSIALIAFIILITASTHRSTRTDLASLKDNTTPLFFVAAFHQTIMLVPSQAIHHRGGQAGQGGQQRRPRARANNNKNVQARSLQCQGAQASGKYSTSPITTLAAAATSESDDNDNNNDESVPPNEKDPGSKLQVEGLVEGKSTATSRAKLLSSDRNNLNMFIPSQLIKKNTQQLNKGSIKAKVKESDESSSKQMSPPVPAPVLRNKPQRGSGRGNYKRPRVLFGNQPNLYWGAIRMDELRAHPRFTPLAPRVKQLHTLSDVNQFRQDSWQWDVLHEGRITTSILAASLGFLNPKSARILGVPRSLQHQGANRAWERWNETPLFSDGNSTVETIATLNHELIEHDTLHEYLGETNNDTAAASAWAPKTSSRYPFAARYKTPKKDQQGGQQQHHNKTTTQTHSSTKSDNHPIPIPIPIAHPIRLRMEWGNIQEPSSILTALNYFTRYVDPDIRIHEVGMCLLLNSTNDTSLNVPPELEGLLGATPDALIVYPPAATTNNNTNNGTTTSSSPSPLGRVEVLEVKNHCPFVSNHQQRNPLRHSNYSARPQNSQPQSSFASSSHAYYSQFQNCTFRTRPFLGNQVKSSNGTVTDNRLFQIPPQYIPQLMMEMACVGSHCRSAIMVRQTATDGAVILRLHRSDAWLQEMIFWLMQFRSQFVVPGDGTGGPNSNHKCGPPPDNFFWEGSSKNSKKKNKLTSDDDGQEQLLFERYQKFVAWTKRLGEANDSNSTTVDGHNDDADVDDDSNSDIITGMEVVAHLKNDQIQRAGSSEPGFYQSLFLDQLT
jgi:hypothetical protein